MGLMDTLLKESIQESEENQAAKKVYAEKARNYAEKAEAYLEKRLGFAEEAGVYASLAVYYQLVSMK